MSKEIGKAVGIDMGGTSVKIGICAGPEVIARAEPIPTQEYEGAEALIDAMVAAIAGLRKDHPVVHSVGIGVPGFVDSATGYVHELTNVKGWVEIPLTKLLAAKTGLPAAADNDANCMTYAEFRHGAGKGARNLIATTLGTGVGGGLVLEGKLFHGSKSGAGEIGQMSIDVAGRPGSYGNTGALEEYVGNNEIAARAKYLYQLADREVSAADCSPVRLSAAAVAGDPVAAKIWDEISTMLACGLSNCVWLLNPDAVIIGGGISKAGDLLFRPLRSKMRAQLADTFCRDLRIEPAAFSNDAGLIGSAAVGLDAAFGVA
ncbi:ROK family protein [soil metagenome]